MSDSSVSGGKILSLNSATVKEQWNLRQCIEGAARHGIAGISPWRDKLQECGVSEAAKMIADNGLEVTGVCRGGMFTAPDSWDNVLEDNRRAVDEAVGIGSNCLVMVVGGLIEDSRDIKDARKRVRDGLAQTVEYARTVNMPIAIEPLHPMYAADRACVNTMAHANDLCDDIGDGIGIALDVYHTWWDPDLEAQIARAGKERLLAFHICDWLKETSDLLLDRGMMGDGVVDIAKIRGWVDATGFEGLNEVEIFSAGDWWKRDADDVLKIMVERSATVNQ